jgi:aspartate/methionine/tyrosine aminotransferase
MAHIHEVVAVNRALLYQKLAGTFLIPCELPFASVSWLRIHHSFTGLRLKQQLDEHGVFVLPGEHFFWNDRRQGQEFIRVALTRDADMFCEAAGLLSEVCRKVADTLPA